MAGSTFNDVWILGGKRTPFGAFGGSLRHLSANDLGVVAAEAAFKSLNMNPKTVDHVIFGNVAQTSADAIYCARHIGLKAGVPLEVPAVTVNRLCGSGFESVAQSAMLIQQGVASCVLAGGTESMSQAPYAVREARWGARMGNVKLEDTLMESLTDSYVGLPMALTAENLAMAYNLSRTEVDKFAFMSQMRTQEATVRGVFQEEVCTVSWEDKKKGLQTIDKDEHPRPQTTLESLAQLKPVFKKDGVVTAGNASGMVDGAVAVLVASTKVKDQLGIKPLGRLVAWGVSGCDPKIMGIGPVPAAKEAFRVSGLTLSDMDIVEINEAFAPQVMAVARELGVNHEILNVNGGAIAIGHPLGASGTRLTLHALLELKRRKKKYALVGACIGGGQGLCLIVENAL